jgi:hypothetical protein
VSGRRPRVPAPRQERKQPRLYAPPPPPPVDPVDDLGVTTPIVFRFTHPEPE